MPMRVVLFGVVVLLGVVFGLRARATPASNIQGGAAARASGSAGAGPVVGAGIGTIRGHIVLTGKDPGNAVIRMSVDPKCAAMNAGKRVIQEAVVTGDNGSLANVFVHLQGTFPETPVTAQPIVIDQRSCIYRPRVIGMRVGQTLQVRNSDSLLHNVHSSSAVGNSFNVAQPMAGMVFEFKPKAEEAMVKLGCDVHRWMTAYVGVVSNPYFAVTESAGSFELGKVPAGTYSIRSWHERFGEMTKSVTIKAGAVSTVDFTYSQKGS
jgi:plastocyanin